jgi:hypothetical protein
MLEEFIMLPAWFGQGFIFINSLKCLDDTMEDDNAKQEICSV